MENKFTESNLLDDIYSAIMIYRIDNRENGFEISINNYINLPPEIKVSYKVGNDYSGFRVGELTIQLILIKKYIFYNLGVKGDKTPLDCIVELFNKAKANLVEDFSKQDKK